MAARRRIRVGSRLVRVDHQRQRHPPDQRRWGTWTMTGRPNGGAALEYSGTSTVNGNRVILSAANGRRWMSLALNGRRLYGPAMVNSRRVMLEFIRVEAPGTRRHAACRSNFVPSTGSVK